MEAGQFSEIKDLCEMSLDKFHENWETHDYENEILISDITNYPLYLGLDSDYTLEDFKLIVERDGFSIHAMDEVTKLFFDFITFSSLF